MITEVSFCRDFSSFWRTTTPTMDGFVRNLNSGLYHRDFHPIDAMTAPNRRSFTNELAFEVFCINVRAVQRGEFAKALAESLQDAIPAVRSAALRAALDGDTSSALSADELADIDEQVRRLTLRICPGLIVHAVVLSPEFSGCGMIDTCRGDVLVGETLFEIKAGDRPFRALDVRQLVTYVALNYAGHQRAISTVALVNPRVGISVEMDLGEFCFEVSGQDTAGLLAEMIYAMSAGEISR